MKNSRTLHENATEPSLLTTNKYFLEIDYSKMPITREYVQGHDAQNKEKSLKQMVASISQSKKPNYMQIYAYLHD